MTNSALVSRTRAAILTATALWTSSPALAQCGVVADLTPGNLNNNNIDDITCGFGEELYFSYFSPVTSGELWKWTAQGGAQIVLDMAPGLATSNPDEITPCATAIGPRVFFRAFEIGHGREVYISDGTAGGTGRLMEIQPGSGSSWPLDFAASGGKVFFNARETVHGEELWVSDGTPAGTVRISDFAPGTLNGRPNDMIDLDGQVIFSAYDPNTGRELFRSDGTAAGSHLLLDIEPGPTTSTPDSFTRVGDLIYFTATTSAFGREVWKTDGTAAGTSMIADTFQGSSAGPTDLCACGDQLFFRNWSGNDVYVTDGSAAGTINLGVTGGDLTCSGDRVFFRGYHWQSGSELWTSDGTIAGTQLVADLLPGSSSANPQKLIDCGTGVCFLATVTTSSELWFSDGTAAGTTHLCTLDAGGNANPDLLTMCRGRLFMNAYSPSHGRELFGIQTPGAAKDILGSGGGPDYPTLGTTNGAVPVLGATVHIEGTGPVGHTGVLLAGGPGLPAAVPALPGLIEGGLDWVGLQGGTAIVVATLFSPNISVPFAIPNNTAFEGLVFNFQMVWFHPTATPTLQVSNGLQLVLGTAAPH